jgi:hypothetical protein
MKPPFQSHIGFSIPLLTLLGLSSCTETVVIGGYKIAAQRNNLWEILITGS